MNANKNAVLKFSPFTSGLTRALKGNSARLHCNVDADGMIYICNGYFVVKLSGLEYDALVRPVTQRDAGNWALNDNGEISPAPINLVDILADAAQEAAHELTPAPFLVDPCVKSAKAKIAPYYSESGDFVSGFNSDYAAIIDPSLPRKSKNAVSPMVIYSGDEPQAMILPVQLNEEKSRVPAAVRAYFTDKPQSADEKLQQARKDRDDWEQKSRRLEAERVGLEHTISELQKVLADKTAEIETLAERLNAQPDTQSQEEAAAEEQQEQSPADKAAALVEELSALDGVTATIKGAQTAAPVVWLTGEADAHKDEIEKLGCKWSGKRSAWYFKIA